MITQTRVKSGKQAQKIGYASVKPIMSDVNVLPEVTATTRFTQPLPEGRLGVSMSGGYYTPYNTSIPGGQYYTYQSKLAGKTWYQMAGYLRKYLCMTSFPAHTVPFFGSFVSYNPGFSITNESLAYLYAYSLDASGSTYINEHTIEKYSNDQRARSAILAFNLFNCGVDTWSFPYLPPGIPIIFPKLTSFYQESMFLPKSSVLLYTEDPDDGTSPVFIPYQNHSVGGAAAYDGITGGIGSGYATSDPFIRVSGSIVGADANQRVPTEDVLRRFCCAASAVPSVYTDQEGGVGYDWIPEEYWPVSFCEAILTGYYYSASLPFPYDYASPLWPSGKVGFATNYGFGEYSGYYPSEFLISTPFAGSIPYLSTSKASYEYKYATAQSDHIDFLVKSLFLLDSTTGELSFKPLEDDLDIYTFATNSKFIEPPTTAPPSGTWITSGGFSHSTASATVAHTIVDAKRLISDWFSPIHAAIQTKSTITPGEAISPAFVDNCNRQRFNVRLDLLELDVLDFPEREFSIVITNPGVFINANDAAGGPFYSFCNSELNSGTNENNLFIDIYFFPHAQFYSSDVAPDVLDVVATGIAAGSTELPNAVVSSMYVRKLKSYYESFDKIGQYFTQYKQIDAQFLNIYRRAPEIDRPNFGLSYTTHWGPTNFSNSFTASVTDAAANFLDYYSSSFEIYIVAGHLTAEDIADPHNIDLSGRTILYSSKSIADKDLLRVSNIAAATINKFIKPLNYSILFPYFDQESEGVLFSYSAALFSFPAIVLNKNTTDTTPFSFKASPGCLTNKLNPFFNLIAAETGASDQLNYEQDFMFTSGKTFVNYMDYPKKDRYPFQFSWFPVPVGPFEEPPSYADEVAYIKEYGSFYEFKCYFTGYGFYDVGTLDSFFVGAFGTNNSKTVKCYVECLEDPVISAIVPPETSAQFISEIDLVTTNFFSTAYTTGAQFHKYPYTFEDKAWGPSSVVFHNVQTSIPHYSTESGAGLVIDPAPMYVPGDTYFDHQWRPSDGSGGQVYYPAGMYCPNVSQNKVLDKKIDLRFFVLTFRVYVAPVPGHIIDPAPEDPFYPGYNDSGTLKADGIVDFKLEFCSPLWDDVDEDYKYLSVEDSPDKTQYDSIFRVYSGMLYPYYLKKLG